MHRFIRLVSCILVLSMLSLNAFAADGGNGWSSFLDYGYGSFRGNYLSFTSSGKFNYKLPFTVSVRSVQGLIQGSGKTITSVSIGYTGSSNTYPCTLIPLGNGLYKFYITPTDKIMNSNEFQLYLTNDGSSNTVARLLEFEYTETRSLLYAETGWYDLYWFNGSTTVNKTATMPSSSSPVSTYFGTTAGETNNSRSFNCYFAFSDWKNYDFLQYHIRIQADFLNSLSATIGDQPLPFEISYINSTSGTNLYGDIYSESIDIAEGANSFYQTEGSFYFLEHNRNFFDITVTVDVRNCDLHSSDFPKIDIRGLQSLVENYNFVQLVYCCGIVEYEPVSPLYAFLGSVRSWLNDIYDSISSVGSSIVERLDALLEREDTSQSDDFQDDLASQATEMENIDEILDSVTKPSLDDIDTSVDDIVSGADVTRYTGILRLLLSNSIISSICLMSLTFAFISYVIFGKR